MIPKKVGDIALPDVQQLITDEVAESKTIEYKLTLPTDSPADRKEFLADVSSFANASGGDLIYGVEEQQGVPVSIPGLTIGDPDLEIRRLDNLIRDGIRPRIKHAIRTIQLPDGRRLMLCRVERSWTGPHRVVFQGHDKFYGRTSAGKYPLDVEELRAAFTLSQSAVERLRAFRVDRIIALSDNITPVPFRPGGKIVLHCIPVDAFSTSQSYDVLEFDRQPALLRPPREGGGWSTRITLEGILSYSGQPVAAYTHVFRNGVIESVEGTLLNYDRGGHRIIPSQSYEQVPMEHLPRCFRWLEMIGVRPPIVVSLTLTNVRGAELSHNELDYRFTPINMDTLALPEVVVEDYNESPARILKPMFDVVWNACGLPGSDNFDNNGNWSPRRG